MPYGFSIIGFKERFPDLNEIQLRCLALLYGAFYAQQPQLAILSVKYCIVEWVCGNFMISELDELILTFTVGVVRNYFPRTAKAKLSEADYKIRYNQMIKEKQDAKNEVDSNGGGFLKYLSEM